MPVRRAITEPDGVYFITITCARWVSLFQLTNGYDIVYNWFDYLKQQRHYITGYVIMPDHLHAVIAFSNSGTSIPFSAECLIPT
jgi:REP element-mobilizing transposase RayT